MITLVYLYCFIVLLCVFVVLWPVIIYFPTPMAWYSLFVLKMPLNTNQLTTNYASVYKVWLWACGSFRVSLCLTLARCTVHCTSTHINCHFVSVFHVCHTVLMSKVFVAYCSGWIPFLMPKQVHYSSNSWECLCLLFHFCMLLSELVFDFVLTLFYLYCLWDLYFNTVSRTVGRASAL